LVGGGGGGAYPFGQARGCEGVPAGRGPGRNLVSPGPRVSAPLTLPLVVNSDTPALAVLEGALCLLNRTGQRRVGHAPLATAIVEFRQGPLRYYVREHTFGLLPGIPNLYCLDAAFRLQWMAEWSDSSDPFASIGEDDGDVLLASTVSGRTVRLDALTGRLLGVSTALAAAV
jgi:hypothetical protein